MRYLFSFIFALVLCAGVWAQAPSAEEPPDVTAKVLEVIDGDTFAVRDPVTNRRKQISLPALDAPELAQARGKEAKKSLEKLINGREVTISYVVRSKRPVVAKVTANGADVGLAQLTAGWAWFIRGKPFKDGDNDRRQYGLAETEAKTAKRGLWQDAEPLTPAKYRKQAKEAAFGPAPPLDEQIVGNKVTRKYHMPHCAGYKGVALKNRALFATATDAEKEGYTLAGNCRATPKPKPKPVAATNEAAPASPALSAEDAPFVGNKNSKIYHKRGCPGYKRVTPLNAVGFLTSEAAEAAGYRRAKNCN
jgi:endonuclease YncB( thermonuclease family)